MKRDSKSANSPAPGKVAQLQDAKDKAKRVDAHRRADLSPLGLSVLAQDEILSFSSGDGSKAPAILDALVEKAEAISQGDLKPLEHLLLAQATRSETLAGQLVRLGMPMLVSQFSAEQGIKVLELAAKFQNESRKSIATLAELKNPKRTTFVKNQQNNLYQDGQNGRMDRGAQTEEKRIDSAREAVVEIDRGKNPRREEAIEYERL
jgi:hypothetical protein